MGRTPAVTIHHPSGPDRPLIINEVDYDPEVHRLWGEKAEDADAGVEQYATGGGWYDVPGADRKMRKADAVAFLKSEED